MTLQLKCDKKIIGLLLIHVVQWTKTGTWTIQKNVLEYIFEISVCNSVLTEFKER